MMVSHTAVDQFNSGSNVSKCTVDILTQASVMSANIEMKSYKSEAVLLWEMVEAI